MKITDIKTGFLKAPGKKFIRVVVRFVELRVVKDNTDSFTLGNELLKLNKNEVSIVGFFVKITVEYIGENIDGGF